MLLFARSQAPTHVFNSIKNAFSGLNFKRKPTRKDLEKYDVIWVGCNLGGICSRQFDKASHGHYSQMVVLDENTNQLYPMRTVYE